MKIYGEIRTKEIDFTPWICLKDVCKILDIKQTTKIKSRLNPKGVITNHILTKGGMQKALFINESNLYKVIFQSRKPEAEEFTEWVTSEVLPTIRKTGSYSNEKMEIAKLIIQCKSASAVKAIMKIYGYEKDGVNNSYLTTSNIESYFNDIDSSNIAGNQTKTVYNDYISYCRMNNLETLPLAGFSKEMRKKGYIVKRHRVNGKLTGFYEIN